jgi:predicted PurR-regulated permease PerM
MIPNKVKIDSLLSISIVLIAAQLFGIIGMVFAIPIFIIYTTILRESYDELVKIYPEKKYAGSINSNN